MTDLDFINSIDASLWAKRFCERNPAIDESVMLGWFANAIMAGYDKGRAELTPDMVGEIDYSVPFGVIKILPAASVRAKKAEARVAKLETMLRWLEWFVRLASGDFCPVCANDKRDGHAPDCKLAVLLAGGDA